MIIISNSPYILGQINDPISSTDNNLLCILKRVEEPKDTQMTAAYHLISKSTKDSISYPVNFDRDSII